MAVFRKVHAEFWQDPKVLEEMTPEDKYFMLYLLTNPNTTQIGIYQISKKTMAFELGYSMESITSLMDRFINNHKIIKYNKETREIAIKNWGKYNLNRAGKPMEDCVKSELKEVKDLTLVEYVGEKVKSANLKALYDTYTIRAQEEEEEKEKEKEEEEEEEKEKESSMGANAPEASASKIGFEAIKNYWNGLDLKPAIRNITAKRQSHIRARIKEFDLDTFYQMMDLVSQSEFLLKPDNTWFSFDWCINPNNFTKIIEGKYSDEVKSDGIDSKSDKANGREEPWERKDSWAEILGEGYTD